VGRGHQKNGKKKDNRLESGQEGIVEEKRGKVRGGNG